IARQRVGKFGFTLRQLRAFSLGMPEMDHTGGKNAVLTAHARMKKPGDNIGVFFSPAPIVRIEPVDAIKIGSPDGEIARARALPRILTDSPENAEWQSQKGQQPVDATTRALANPAAGAPDFKGPALPQHARGQRRRKQDAVA